MLQNVCVPTPLLDDAPSLRAWLKRYGYCDHHWRTIYVSRLGWTMIEVGRELVVPV